MASTNFQDYNQNTPIVATWLNDVDGVTYSPSNLKKVASNSAAAWVRFVGASGVIQQSNNIMSVTRVSVGVYTILYANPMGEATNSYGVSSSLAGFNSVTAETTNSVTLAFTNISNAPADPGSISVQIFGVN